MTYQVNKVSEELTGWLKLKNMIENDCLDAECLLDTLDGETELYEALCAVKESVLQDEMLLAGLNEYIKKLQQRKARISNGIEVKNNIILSAMVSAEIPSIKGPLFTMSKGKVAPKVIITNESDIPTQFWKSQDPVVDKAALKKALNDKNDIPGVMLSNGGISLITRIL